MSHTGSELPLEVEKWTVEEVHLWLTTQVKVHHTYADKFREEDVLGEYLVDFKKKDVLDFGIKHGPAVKIISFVEHLKKGSEHESQCPAYVEKWTKEQVYQWLVDYVKLYPKYAKCLQEEDVSGDCLVCFTKQDLLDLGVKGGPAVKILAELDKLDRKHEPTLQPSTHVSSEPTVSPKHVERQPDPSASELVPVSAEKTVKDEDRRPKQHVSQKKEPKPHAAKPTSAKHFVDQHRSILIEKVTNVKSILDVLLQDDVITQEGYDNVTSKATNQEKMRELYRLLNSRKAKDIFYKGLKEYEVFLLDDLYTPAVHSPPSLSATQPKGAAASVSERHYFQKPEEPVKVEDRRQPPKQHASQRKEPKPHAAKSSEVNVNMPWKTILLQKTLEDLGKEEMERFIFYLRMSGVPGFPAIKRSHVEDKSIVQLVDLMTKHYGMDTALDVTLQVLDKIPRADLVLHLKKEIEEKWLYCPV